MRSRSSQSFRVENAISDTGTDSGVKEQGDKDLVSKCIGTSGMVASLLVLHIHERTNANKARPGYCVLVILGVAFRRDKLSIAVAARSWNRL